LGAGGWHASTTRGLVHHRFRAPGFRGGAGGEWRLDETSWANGVLDSSRFAHHGTAVGGAFPLGGHGVFPNAPGCSNCAYVDVPGDLGLGNAQALTVTAWVRWSIDPLTGTPRAVMVSQSSPTVAPASAMTRDAGLFGLRATRAATRSPVPRQGEWTHLAGVFDGTNARIYVNGTLERSTSAPGRVAAMRPEYRLQIGAAPVDEGPGIGRRAG
jgi:hypothetical protein